MQIRLEVFRNLSSCYLPKSGRELDGVPRLQNTAKRRDEGDHMPESKLEVGIAEVKWERQAGWPAP
jgi:hypothetical protein